MPNVKAVDVYSQCEIYSKVFESEGPYESLIAWIRLREVAQKNDAVEQADQCANADDSDGDGEARHLAR